ncbi:uncharacterized protein LOC143342686 [Colletes latitarsis]|uniref:uncharacterized protein LOC143342686 n=1 Tax=Colletes latitarsis TaxID=2605962 RepID=UPI004035F633
MFNKHQGSEFLVDINEFEYPRANETLKQMHEQLWQEYYECLKQTYNEIGSEKMIHPIALIALEGTLAKLNCQICISPIEVHTIDNIEWYFNRNSLMIPNNETNKLLEESDNILISPNDRRLLISNIKTEQEGLYWCKLGDTASTFYYVSIDTDSQGIKVVHPAEAPLMPHATSKQIIPKYNLIIYTTWTKWSSCSMCNIVGKKYRYGYCTISFQENLINQKKEIMKSQDLQDYKSQEILNISNVKNRKTEMMVKYCKIKCIKNIIFETRDKQGNVLESANNSAGIYSMVQGIPIPLPPVTRTIIFEKYKKKATLKCPGNLNTDVPITWKMGNKILNPTIIKDQSRGRIYINLQMHIIFKSLKFEDTNIYSCWQKDVIAGVIKLNVVGETELQVNYSVVMIGGIVIIIVFLIVFWRAFQGRKRFTIH